MYLLKQSTAIGLKISLVECHITPWLERDWKCPLTKFSFEIRRELTSAEIKFIATINLLNKLFEGLLLNDLNSSIDALESAAYN